MDFAGFPQRVTRTLGVDPYLERLFPPDLALAARLLVVLGLGMWLLVVVTFLSSLHLRHVLRQPAASHAKAALLERGRQLRRIGRWVRWLGYAGLLGGIVLSLALWLSAAPNPFQPLALSALVHFGLMQPCSLMAELYGGALDDPAAIAS